MTWLRRRPISRVVLASVLVVSAAGAYISVSAHHPAPANRAQWIRQEAFLFGSLAVLNLMLIAAMRRIFSSSHEELAQVTLLQRTILESAGPMILATDLDGRFTAFNPSAERLLGYSKEEMLGCARFEDVFLDGALRRVGRQLVTSLNLTLETAPEPDDPENPLQDYVEYVGSFPPNRVRGFEIEYKRKDGSTFPGMVYLSAIRESQGSVTGLLAICTDMSATKRAEHALRESQERYRDLFENSNEMIATLSPRGRYLYVNPAWQSHFGLSADDFEGLISFESAFPPETQASAAALFRRALTGERVERAYLRFYGSLGRVIEVEGNLSCRQEEGQPVSVRCLFRDVTQERQRERQMSMQLLVAQLVGESTRPEQALPRVLESLGSSMGWDVAIIWRVNPEQQYLSYHTGWYGPGHGYQEFGRVNIGRILKRGEDLPGRVWGARSALWVVDLRKDPAFGRLEAAQAGGLVTGWSIPVRVGNKVTAVLEFFSHEQQKEDPEMIAAVETVCASLGQFMARSAQEGQLRELNRHKEFILNSVADGIFGTDREGVVIFVNPAAEKLLGAVEGSVMGRQVRDVIHMGRNGPAFAPGSSDVEAAPTMRAFSTPQGTSGQDVFFRSDGTSFPVEFSLTPMQEGGSVVGSVLSFRDISQRYALDRMKDEFISTVSHELRTPLTSIRGALGLLSAGLVGEVSEKAANLLRIAVSNSDRLVRLINDILDLERMQSGRSPLTFRRTGLGDIAQQALEALAPVAEAAKIRMVLEAGTATVEADPDRLQQVLTNLLSNAIKFSPPDAEVRVLVKGGSAGATISVIDQGRGIPADKLESIFDRFQQVDASDSRQKGGTGLGLAICRTIIHQHGGRIWAERNPDRGTTFSLFVPFRQSAEIESTPFPDREARDGTILISDRDAQARRTVADNLTRHGYKVVEAEDAEQTMAQARHFPLEAILLDISLNSGSGWQTLQMLKNDPVTSAIPVVVLSVWPSTEHSDIPEHVDGWVQKPLDEVALLSELARVLHGGAEPARVLIVEDDEDLARIILTTFQRAGIEVQHAATRRRAIELCEAFPPDLVILDLSLPDGDGFNVVDWLRQQKDLSKTPLVVYSARDVMDFERRQLQLGPTEFLTKASVQPQEVEALVLTMLRRLRKVEDEIQSNGDAAISRPA
jgi:PAS domain S-box-containing protein